MIPSTDFDPARVRRLSRSARAELAKRYLADFVQQAIAAGEVHGISKVEWGPHLTRHCFEVQMQLEAWLVAYGYGTDEMIARQREAWERTGAVWEDGLPEPWLRYVLVQNAIDNLPPGTLKSTIAMVCANAWIWLHCATFMFGAASGIDANVTRDSNATRELVQSKWYRETFAIAWTTHELDAPAEQDPDIRLDPKSDSVSDWATTAGGRRYSRTIRRGFTGMHVDATFVDDADDADNVWNEASRLMPQNRFTRAIENRVNCEHRSIRRSMQQVVHPEGFTAYLLSIARWSPQNPKGWSQLCIPAEWGMQPADAPRETPYGTRDWRTEKGEIIHPRLSPGVLADKRAKLPGYEGQYNQNAERIVDGLFKRQHARFFVFEGTNIETLRRRPEGCRQRGEDPPIVLRLDQLERIALSVDAANSLNPKPGSKVSAVGLVVKALYGETNVTLDDRTRVLGPSGTYLAIYELIRDWPLGYVLVELKALGAGVIEELRTAIRRGWYLHPETDQRVELVGPDGNRAYPEVVEHNPGTEDKVQRGMAMLPDWHQGRSFLLDGAPWLYPQVDANRKTVDEGYIGERCSFPGSRRSDRVDAESQYAAWCRTPLAVETPDITFGAEIV